MCCVNLALLFSLLFCCHVSGAKICKGYQDIKWVLVAVQPTSEANESRALEGSFLTPEFRSRNDHLLNFVRSSLAELVDVQLGYVWVLYYLYCLCLCFILVLLGRFGDNYWYVWYLRMLLMQRWQMLRGNWTCSFPMVSLCQRLWASLNLTILIYLNHVDHTGP